MGGKMYHTIGQGPRLMPSYFSVSLRGWSPLDALPPGSRQWERAWARLLWPADPALGLLLTLSFSLPGGQWLHEQELMHSRVERGLWLILHRANWEPPEQSVPTCDPRTAPQNPSVEEGRDSLLKKQTLGPRLRPTELASLGVWSWALLSKPGHRPALWSLDNEAHKTRLYPGAPVLSASFCQYLAWTLGQQTLRKLQP